MPVLAKAACSASTWKDKEKNCRFQAHLEYSVFKYSLGYTVRLVSKTNNKSPMLYLDTKDFYSAVKNELMTFIGKKIEMEIITSS